MALRGTVDRPLPLLRSRSKRTPSLELRPGLLATLRTAIANARSKQDLAASSELAERGRTTGARI